MRILFAGTSEIAVPVLKVLSGDPELCVVGVLTASDKPAGRSKTPVPSPVKAAALSAGLNVIECEHVNKTEREKVAALCPDLLLSFSFGRIFGPRFLSLFKKTMNIHPSELPQFRGPSPVHAAILSGRREWAISFQEIGLEMDCGNIYACEKITLDGTEDQISLTGTLGNKAAELICGLLKNLPSPVPQSGGASYCSFISKEDGIIDFAEPVSAVHARIRAMYPWPKASANLDGQQIFLCGVYGGFDAMYSPDAADAEPGTVVAIKKDRGIGVACKDGTVWITRLQAPTKKETDFKDFINSHRDIVGKKFC